VSARGACLKQRRLPVDFANILLHTLPSAAEHASRWLTCYSLGRLAARLKRFWAYLLRGLCPKLSGNAFDALGLLVQNPEKTKDRPTARGFHLLLEWLDQGTNSEGQRYLELRRRLLRYFDRKNCLLPEELADETLNRVAAKLEEEIVLEGESPARYCYITARFVFLENLRSTRKDQVLVDEIRRRGSGGDLALSGVDEDGEMRFRCLEQCVGKLETLSRSIILQYYAGNEGAKIQNRRRLAESLAITMNALSIRACRIRGKLEACVKECMGAE